jgi:hypothetical protein
VIPDWTAIGAIAQVATLVAIPVSIFLYWAKKEDEWERFYAILDQQYMDILRLVIEKPYLSDQNQKRIGPKSIEYDAFAFIVWNFVESIFDYCEKDERLRETWGVILELEALKHAAWFNHPRNRIGFKQRFRDYIDKEGYTIICIREDPCRNRDE